MSVTVHTPGGHEYQMSAPVPRLRLLSVEFNNEALSICVEYASSFHLTFIIETVQDSKLEVGLIARVTPGKRPTRKRLIKQQIDHYWTEKELVHIKYTREILFHWNGPDNRDHLDIFKHRKYLLGASAARMATNSGISHYLHKVDWNSSADKDAIWEIVTDKVPAEADASLLGSKEAFLAKASSELPYSNWSLFQWRLLSTVIANAVKDDVWSPTKRDDGALCWGHNSEQSSLICLRRGDASLPVTVQSGFHVKDKRAFKRLAKQTLRGDTVQPTEERLEDAPALITCSLFVAPPARDEFKAAQENEAAFAWAHDSGIFQLTPITGNFNPRMVGYGFCFVCEKPAAQVCTACHHTLFCSLECRARDPCCTVGES